MVHSVEREPQMDFPHPGELLSEEVLPAMGLSVSRAAREMGVSRQHLHRILKGTHPITPDTALRLGKLCGNGAAFWLRLQMAYDLSVRADALADELARIPTYDAA